MPDPILALDTGSPVVSVALWRDGAVAAARSTGIERSSTRLLAMVSEVLAEAGLEMGEVEGVAVLRGPGSFTGVRVGLATVLGLHQSLGMAATTLPTLQALAAAPAIQEEEVVIAAVDALRGEWSVQAFAPGPVPRPLGEVALLAGSELPRLAGGRPAVVTGFGMARLAELPGWPAEVRLAEAGPLAGVAARLAAAAGAEWDPSLLTHPLYARPAAISLPRSRTAARVS